jgi:hypothetical protein
MNRPPPSSLLRWSRSLVHHDAPSGCAASWSRPPTPPPAPTAPTRRPSTGALADAATTTGRGRGRAFHPGQRLPRAGPAPAVRRPRRRGLPGAPVQRGPRPPARPAARAPGPQGQHPASRTRRLRTPQLAARLKPVGPTRERDFDSVQGARGSRVRLLHGLAGTKAVRRRRARDPIFILQGGPAGHGRLLQKRRKPCRDLRGVAAGCSGCQGEGRPLGRRPPGIAWTPASSAWRSPVGAARR